MAKVLTLPLVLAMLIKETTKWEKWREIKFSMATLKRGINEEVYQHSNLSLGQFHEVLSFK